MISEFKGESRFLSNFFAVPIMYEGVEYPSVEHAFQAAKSLDPEERINPGKGHFPYIHLPYRLLLNLWTITFSPV